MQPNAWYVQDDKRKGKVITRQQLAEAVRAVSGGMLQIEDIAGTLDKIECREMIQQLRQYL